MDIKTQRRIIEFVEDWYFYKRVAVPENVESADFAHYAGLGSGLTDNIQWYFGHTERDSDLSHLKYMIADKAKTSAIDINNATVYLPAYMFKNKTWQMYSEPSKIAISVINGTILHEVGHYLLPSPSVPGNYIDALDEEFVKKYSKAALLRVLNLLEDVLVEGKLPLDSVYSAACFVRAKNDYHYSPESLLMALETLQIVPTLSPAVDLAAHFCNMDLSREVLKVLPKKAADVLVRLRNISSRHLGMTSAAEKLAAIKEFASQFAPDNPLPPDKPDYTEETSEMLMTPAEKQRPGDHMLDGKIRDEFYQAAKKESDRVNGLFSFVHSDRNENAVTYQPILKNGKEFFKNHGIDWSVEGAGKEMDYAFMRMIKALRTINNVPGLPVERGLSLVPTRIYRIITDSKIFAQRNELDVNKRVEVVLLVDCSGSTRQAYKLDERGVAVPLFMEELWAAYHSFITLRDAGVGTTVVAHSSIEDEKGRDTCLLVTLASHDMTGIETNRFDLERTFLKAMSSGGWLSENYDGTAIATVADKFFTGRKARRVMISISDGVPSGNQYHGESAIKDTMRAIQYARNMGINVFSLSVVKDVVKRNSGIYGKQWNLDASRGDIEKQLQALISSIM